MASKSSNLRVLFEFLEKGTSGDSPPVWPAKIDLSQSFSDGTAVTQADVRWFRRKVAAGSADTIDVSAMASELADLGNVTAAGGVLLMVIKNNATTSGYDLTVGNAAANGIVFDRGAATHTNVIPPGGFYAWFAGTVDDQAPGTDINIKVDPDTNTLTYEVLILGRSS